MISKIDNRYINKYTSNLSDESIRKVIGFKIFKECSDNIRHVSGMIINDTYIVNIQELSKMISKIDCSLYKHHSKILADISKVETTSTWLDAIMMMSEANRIRAGIKNDLITTLKH